MVQPFFHAEPSASRQLCNPFRPIAHAGMQTDANGNRALGIPHERSTLCLERCSHLKGMYCWLTAGDRNWMKLGATPTAKEMQ